MKKTSSACSFSCHFRRWFLLTGLTFLWCGATGYAEETPPQFDWIPPEAMADELRSTDTEQIIPEIAETSTPKTTADDSKFTRVYEIELAKFGISNDGTRAEETSKGVNAALQHAKTLNANRIVFPAGTYLISETDPVVLDHKDTVVDLNGATLQIQSNGLPKYHVLEIVMGADNMRLTNGTIRGDRDTHDYKSRPGTHEWGTALHLAGGKNLEVDHLTLTKGSGDGISMGHSGTRTRPELLARIKHSILRAHLEPGGFSDRGEKVAHDQKIRTIDPYRMDDGEKTFELGYLGGSCGFPFIKSRVYQAYFLDENQRLIEMKKCLQYRKVEIPDGTKTAHFEFNQAEIPDKAFHTGASNDGWIARIANFLPPTDVHFHHNILTGNRRLGMAYTGGQRWVIEENRFEDNGGTNPAFGVDFEDGAELLHDVIFRKNTFKGNQAGDLVLAAGTELHFEDNVFEKTVAIHGRPHNYVFRHNRFNGGSVIFRTRTGVAQIDNNQYTNCKVSVIFDTKGVADGLVRNNPGDKVATPPLQLTRETLENVESVGGTYLNFRESQFKNTRFVAGMDTSMIEFRNCEFDDSSLEFTADGPVVSYLFENNKGSLSETGPGIERKKVISTSDKPPVSKKLSME